MEGGGSAAAAKKKEKNVKKMKSDGASQGPPSPVVPIDQVLATSDALRDRLVSLGATLPWYVTEKKLWMSDVKRHQARLLISCKREPLALYPLKSCFTELEMRRVEDKKIGLLVTALDRGGRSYDLTCKYLYCNNGYRFITDWNEFLKANGLELDGEGKFPRDVHVELWAFRSQALPNRLLEDKKKKKDRKKTREETGHPDGSLGLVLLHYEYEYGEHGGDDREEEGMDGAPKSPVTQEKVASAGTEQRDTAARAMTKDEMIAKFGEKMALAAIGMNMLKGYWAKDFMDSNSSSASSSGK